MILSVTLSKPTAAVRETLGNDFIRIKNKTNHRKQGKECAGKGGS